MIDSKVVKDYEVKIYMKGVLEPQDIRLNTIDVSILFDGILEENPGLIVLNKSNVNYTHKLCLCPSEIICFTIKEIIEEV